MSQEATSQIPPEDKEEETVSNEEESSIEQGVEEKAQEDTQEKQDSPEPSSEAEKKEDAPVKQQESEEDDSTEKEAAEDESSSTEDPPPDTGGLLVPLDDYLSNGIHVGLKYRTQDMASFIYKVRPDKLCVFDVQKIDQRLRTAIKFLSSYTPEQVLVVSNRMYGRTPITKFAEHTGCKVIPNRLVSGTLTNPQIESYNEAKVLLVTDPTSDQQAITEASAAGLAIVALCDSNTRTRNIDLVIPCNNKGKNALGLTYWILTRELLAAQGKKGFDAPVAEFISKAEPQPYLLEQQEQLRRKARNRRRGGFRRR